MTRPASLHCQIDQDYAILVWLLAFGLIVGFAFGLVVGQYLFAK
jgi:hypothetical protein